MSLKTSKALGFALQDKVYFLKTLSVLEHLWFWVWGLPRALGTLMGRILDRGTIHWPVLLGAQQESG